MPGWEASLGRFRVAENFDFVQQSAATASEAQIALLQCVDSRIFVSEREFLRY